MNVMSNRDADGEVFDYVIIGAGSAGCVLAERLSVDPAASVLVIEAGGEADSAYIGIPMGVGKTLANPSLTWIFATEPDPGNANRPAFWLRGKALGGSSSINGMIYCRGHPQDYDDWEAMGCEGWGWEHMAPVFKQIEDHELGGEGKRGVGGPLHISIQTHRSPLTEAIIAASDDLGVPRARDVNEPDGEAIGYTPVTIRNGRRVSAYDAFLSRARKRPNVRIVTHTVVTRILFEGQRAIGVEAVRAGGREIFRARREVILSAGALLSPQLLQLSGIGAAAELEALGIPVVVDSPGVGQHMREHKVVTVQVGLNGPYSHNLRLRGWRLWLNAIRYFLTRSGPLASTYDINGFIKTKPELDRPDAQVTFWSLSMDKNAQGFELESEPGMFMMGYPCRSTSEGSIRLRSADINDPPLITTNFLATDYDREILLGIFDYARRVFRHQLVAPFIKREAWPGPDVQDEDQILNAIRLDGTCQHASSTCRMGDFPDAVLDSRLRVKGVSGLRVMDCSVLPTQVSGNPNGVVMAMAWRASEMILEDARAATPVMDSSRSD